MSDSAFVSLYVIVMICVTGLTAKYFYDNNVALLVFTIFELLMIALLRLKIDQARKEGP